MAPFYNQMCTQAVQGQYKWTKSTPFSNRQRFNLRKAGFTVGRKTVRWDKQFDAVPFDCRSFVSGKIQELPAHYNEAQQLWLIAKRFYRTNS